MHDFDRDGLAYFPNVCSEEELREIESALASVAGEAAGVRLHGIPDLAPPLAGNGCIGKVAASIIGSDARPVRAILFDKNEATNWNLGWHQDRTIVVRERIEVSGLGPWTMKAGLQHVTPPIEILEQMVTLRLHIDAVDEHNAPLMVAKGSHRFGRIAEPDIPDIVAQSEIACCLAERGDVWAYSTPILHASEPSTKPSRRRVLQVDYAAISLPGGLEWLGV
jgi:hypothetical protein